MPHLVQGSEPNYLAAIGALQTNLRLDGASMPDKVWVTRFLPAHRHEGYQNYPILPDITAGRWLGKAALEPLFADTATPPSAVIEVMQMPEELCEAIDAYPRDAFGADRIGDDEIHMERIEAAALRIGDRFIRIALAQPGELTTTTVPLSQDHPERGKKGGPHIDWQGKLPITQRMRSPRRLIGNAGPGTRMTFFCPTDVVTLAHMTRNPEYYDDPYFMFHDWHRDHPDDLLCVGILVEPRQALIINTDACLHDGSTLFATEESLCVQIIGNWGRGSLLKVA
jgi:hypothetical protein